MKSIKYIVLASFIAFVSCEKVLDMDIPDGEHKIVINSLFTDSDSSILVHVSKSLHILDKAESLNLSGAKVKLYEDEILIDTLENLGDGLFGLQNWPLAKGKEYKIEASYEGLKTVNAKNIIPEKTLINAFDTALVKKYDYDYIECRLKLNDPGNTKNYYLVRAVAYSYDEYEEYEYPINLISDDPIVEEFLDWGDSGFLFSDDVINGKSYEIIFYTDIWNVTSWSGNPVIVVFYLETITEEYYKYAKSFSRHKQTTNNPFAEPVQVFCNIENGFGIFAGYSSDMKIVSFEGYQSDEIFE